MKPKELVGEFLGTYVLVFIGCSSVAVAVTQGNLNLYQVATIWGVGVTLAIFASWKLSPAHLNPAVSIAFFLKKEISAKQLSSYAFAQLVGAMFAGLTIILVYDGLIQSYEDVNSITRGSIASQNSAMIFGEFYPNPSNSELRTLSTFSGALLELIGTFILVLFILIITSLKNLKKNFIPPLIGLVVAILIVFIAPYTQAGLNPARDFGPRIIAYFSGWGENAFPVESMGFLIVYILGPMIGGVLGFGVFRLLNRFLNF